MSTLAPTPAGEVDEDGPVSGLVTWRALCAYKPGGWGTTTLPAGEKYPPDKGTTGRGVHAEPSSSDSYDLAVNQGRTNAAIVMPVGTVALDTDHYGEKRGGDDLKDLERCAGPLPDTWFSTARCDGVSGQRFFRMPRGAGAPTEDELPGGTSTGTDIIRHGHRYAVVYPSIHPNGAQYRWYRPDGTPADDMEIPSVDELPELSTKHIDHLCGRCGCNGGAARTSDTSSGNGPFGGLVAKPVATFANNEDAAAEMRRAIGRGAGRHDTMVKVTASLVARGSPEPMMSELRDEFADAVSEDRGSRNEALREWDSAVAGATAKGFAAARAKLDPAFWDSRPFLSHIRRAAHSRGISADAVLGCVLTRAAVTIPIGADLPAIVGAQAPMNFFSAIVGPVGGAKTASRKVAAEVFPYLPPNGDRHEPALMPSSGEGLIEAFIGLVTTQEDGQKSSKREQTKDSALAIIDEGGAIAQQLARPGSTILETLRSMWSGTDAGQHNASSDRVRFLREGSYRLGMIVAVQERHAGAILDDEAGGLPQRMVWFATRDADIPHPDHQPLWPGQIEWTQPVAFSHGGDFTFPEHVNQGIRIRSWERQRGVSDDPFGGHRDLVTMKVAALVAFLAGNGYEVSEEDWETAQAVMERSDAARLSAIEAIRRDKQEVEDASRKRQARLRVAEVDAVQKHQENDAERRAITALGNRAAKEGGPITQSELWRSIRGSDRKLVDQEEVVAAAAAEGLIVSAGEGPRGAQLWASPETLSEVDES